MKKILLLIGLLFICTQDVLPQVSVTFSGDTVKVWDANFTWNCIVNSKKFIPTIDTTKNIINIVQTDTSSNRVRCTCKFTTCAALVGLKAGTYTATVIRKLIYLTKVYTSNHVLKDTLILDVTVAGVITFTVTKNASLSFAQKYSQSSCITEVEEETKATIPDRFELMQNYPNPFNPTTTIRYSIPVEMPGSSRTSLQHVTLKVYDLLGREVATLVNEYKQPGNYNSQFSIPNSQLPSGVYFYTLRAGNYIETKKMILMK